MEQIKTKISLIYYNHGLFCATHPTQVIVSVCLIVIILCYPLTQVSIVSDVPLDHFTLKEEEFRTFENAHLLVSYGNPNKSLGYMQQIVLHSTVIPSAGFACFSLREPVVRALEQSFKLVQLIREFRMNATDSHPEGQSFDDLCFQVEDRAIFEDGTEDTIYNALPTFGCLLLAPSLLWDSADHLRAQQARVFTRLRQASVGNLRDLFFGFMWKMTGISRYPVCARETSLSFAVTLVMRDYNPQFVDELRSHLLAHFAPKQFRLNSSSDSRPISESDRPGSPTESGESFLSQSSSESMLTTAGWTARGSADGARRVYLVWYRVRCYLSDYAPLILIYVVLLLYIYFSVCKLEMVKSKLGLAFSACLTVVASLFMSIGLCINIGLMVPTLNGSEIFPYLVVLIGFENVIILTKSVVATPIDLPVKYRIAQGLSKESWPLTKHYVTQFVLLGLGFFTFHPTMQEFCLFAVVGMTTDFFLQLFFFVTVLSIDIRRMELSDLSVQFPPDSSLVRDSQLLFASTLIDRSALAEPTNPVTVVHSGPYVTDQAALECPVPWNRLNSWLRSIWSQTEAVRGRLRNLFLSWRPSGRAPFRRGHKRQVSAAEAAAFLSSDVCPAENFPRRLQILRLWAKHRLFQRLIAVFMSVWLLIFLIYAVDISQLLPNAFMRSRNMEPSLTSTIGAVKPEQVLPNGDRNSILGPEPGVEPSVRTAADAASTTETTTASTVVSSTTTTTATPAPSEAPTHPVIPASQETSTLAADALSRLNELPLAHAFRHPTEATWNVLLLWNYLAFYHWPLLAKHYNLSLAGYHSVLLEPMHLQYQIQVDPVSSTDASSGDVLSYGNSETAHHVKQSYWKWQPSSNFRLPDFWSVDKYRTESTSSPGNDSKPDSNPLATLTEDLLRLFRQSRRGSASDVSPGGLAGWTARLSLTASMLSTTVLCCSFVLLITCLGMVFFQELQAKSSAPIRREPVIRVLPLTIALTESKDSSSDIGTDSDLILFPEWTIACGKLPTHNAAHGTPKVEGIVAACCCSPSHSGDPGTHSSSNVIRLWSTDSGLPLHTIQRFSSSSMPMRRVAASTLRRPCRRRSTVWSMTFMSDGRLVVGCSDGLMEVWNCVTGDLEDLLSIAYSKAHGATGHGPPAYHDSCAVDAHAETKAHLPANSHHPGGITVLKVVGGRSFLAGTSRGLVALLSPTHSERSRATPLRGLTLPVHQWHPHTRSVTQVAFACLGPADIHQPRTTEDNLLILSASEDAHIAFMLCNMDEPLRKLSLDDSAIIGFDFCPSVVAVSHASGSLYVVRFELADTSQMAACSDSTLSTGVDPVTVGSVPSYRLDVLEQILLATGPNTSNRCSLNSTAKHVQSHAGSIGLQLFGPVTACDTAAARPISDFRLVTCELDGTVAVWNFRPPRLVRSFRLNLSTLSPVNPIVSVDGRVVFGDQGYLRVINPWTAKYERSVQLLPPSTALLRNTSSVSSSLLCAVLRKWSKELAPIGVAGPCHDSFTPVHVVIPTALERDATASDRLSTAPAVCSIEPHSRQLRRPSLTCGSVMVSLADSGRTLVIVPLTTLQTT